VWPERMMGLLLRAYPWHSWQRCPGQGLVMGLEAKMEPVSSILIYIPKKGGLNEFLHY